MHNKNTLTLFEYLLLNFWTGMATITWYVQFLYIPLERYTERISMTLFWCLFVLLLSMGVLATYQRRRNWVNVAVNILLPLHIYTFLSYGNRLGPWIKWAVAVASILTVLFFGVVFSERKPQKTKERKRLICRKVRHSLLGARTIFTFCLCILLVPMLFGFFTGNKATSSQVSAISLSDLEQWTIDNNMETVLKIKPENWETLSSEERLQVLNVLKNIEMRYLGICYNVTLTAEPLTEGTLGSYVWSENKIIIDTEHLEKSDAKDVVHTLVHECHHVYSRQQVDVYQMLPEQYQQMMMFHHVQQYAKEYDNYIEGEDDYSNYKAQWCERDANAYAKEAVYEYYERIAAYEEKGAEQ